MPATNTPQRFGSVAKTFHWLTALLIFAAFPLGVIATELSHQILDPATPATDADLNRAIFLFSMHKTLGITVFFVALLRILWALTQPRPGLLNADKKLEAGLAETVHWLLYGSLLLVPLSGWIHHASSPGFAPIWWPLGQTLPLVPQNPRLAELSAGVHIVLTKVLLLAVVLHVAGALKHHVIDKDATLRRMWPGQSPAPKVSVHRASLVPPVVAAALAALALVGGGFAGVYGHHSASAAAPPVLEQAATDWGVETGTLDISVQQMGSEVSGRFSEWTAAITYAPRDSDGPAGSVEVTVSIPSLTLGSVTDQAMGPDYFDATAFPTAVFAAEILKTADGHTASGTLTIRGESVPVELPFELEIDGATATMSGQMQVNRMDFGIGASTTDEGTLGYGVTISVRLTAARANGA